MHYGPNPAFSIMARLQAQWRVRPDGEWKYHSTPEEITAQEQFTTYLAKHQDRRLFDYRLVDPRGPEALAKPPDPTFVQFDGGSFQFNRTKKDK